MNNYKVTKLHDGVMIMEEVYQSDLAGSINGAINEIETDYPSCEVMEIITFYKDSPDKAKTQYNIVFKNGKDGIRERNYKVEVCGRLQIYDTIKTRDTEYWRYEGAKQVAYQQFLLIFSKKSEQALDRDSNLDD